MFCGALSLQPGSVAGQDRAEKRKEEDGSIKIHLSKIETEGWSEMKVGMSK